MTAKAAAERLRLDELVYNPYANTLAQIVETIHCMDDSRRLLSQLLDNGLSEDTPLVEAREGRGIGAVEVPRGTLYHEYGIDREGRITKPT